MSQRMTGSWIFSLAETIDLVISTKELGVWRTLSLLEKSEPMELWSLDSTSLQLRSRLALHTGERP